MVAEVDMIPPDIQAALERLRNEQIHAVFCPWPARACTCQHIADLALVQAHVAAGARAVEAARRHVIEECVAIVNAQENYPDTRIGIRQDWVKACIREKLRALLPSPAAAPEGRDG